jgi:flagellar basal-body rod protein FlgF
MDAASYIAASGMKSAYRAVEVATNNLANASSPGFKADRPFYRLLQEETDKLSGSTLAGTRIDFSPGTFRLTGNPLDLAINGEGFFAIRTEGGTRYTRNGSFSMTQAGELVTQDGYAVLDTQGKPVVAVSGAGAANEVTVSRAGEVAVDGNIVATLGIYSFADNSTLQKEGDLNFRTDARPQRVVNPEIEQGAVEQSNVDAISSMIELIEMQRMFDINQRTVNTVMNTLNQRAVRELAAQA